MLPLLLSRVQTSAESDKSLESQLGTSQRLEQINSALTSLSFVPHFHFSQQKPTSSRPNLRGQTLALPAFDIA